MTHPAPEPVAALREEIRVAGRDTVRMRVGSALLAGFLVAAAVLPALPFNLSHATAVIATLTMLGYGAAIPALIAAFPLALYYRRLRTRSLRARINTTTIAP